MLNTNEIHREMSAYAAEVVNAEVTVWKSVYMADWEESWDLPVVTRWFTDRDAAETFVAAEREKIAAGTSEGYLVTMFTKEALPRA